LFSASQYALDGDNEAELLQDIWILNSNAFLLMTRELPSVEYKLFGVS
jgi:hypothetical protein